MFAKASRLKLRFVSPKGLLSVEDLWDLPLTSTKGNACLDDIAVYYNNLVGNKPKVSFVVATKGTNNDDQMRFDIVKHIIDVRMQEATDAATARERKERKQEIMAIIEEQEKGDLRKRPVEELRKMLEELN